MKKSLILSILSLAFVALACSPEEFDSVSEGGIPSISDAVVTVDVDQSTNVVTFYMEGDGLYPVWIFSTSSYVTENPYEKTYASAGTYTVEYQVGNRNGLSLGTGSVSFTIENTLTNYDRYTTLLNGKEWRIDNSTAGHFGCGEYGGSGTDWWSAAVDEKDGTGLYENRIYLTSDYEYTFDPGDAGTVFVNYGVTVFSDYTGYDEDFAMPAESQTTTYELSTSGEDVILTLPSQTLFPYISSDNMYNNPEFRIVSLSSSKFELIYDDEGNSISWYFLFTSSEAEETFSGYTNQESTNLWYNCSLSISQYYAYTSSWVQLDNPDYTLADNSTGFTLSLPTGTEQQWQAQFLMTSDVVMSSSNTYDFSCKITSSTDISAVTIKLTASDDDNTYCILEQVSLNAYEEYLFYVSEFDGEDMTAKLVFDFGGNPDNTEITVEDIVLQIHGADGVYAPDDSDSSSDFDGYTNQESTNLWYNCSLTIDQYYAYTSSWVQLDNPDYTLEDNSTGFTLSLPTGTVQQWQAQFLMTSDIVMSSENNYDFSCRLTSTTDISAVTIKLTASDDDNSYCILEQVSLSAYEEYLFYASDFEGIDMTAKLVYDFGGNPDNTEITVTDIVLQTHGADGVYADSGSSSDDEDDTVYTYDSTSNLWKTNVDDTDSYSTYLYYNPGWAYSDSIDGLELTHSSNTWTFTIPYATSAQWQGQFHITPTTAISGEADTAYDFCCTFESTTDCSSITVKMTDADSDDNYNVYKAGISLSAYEPYTVTCPAVTLTEGAADALKLVFDFGGAADNTTVYVTDIVYQKTSE